MELVASCLGGVQTYALIVGIISLLASLTLMILQQKNPDMLLKKLFDLPKIGDVTIELFIADFLFVWWCIGAGIMTFQGPFTVTTNGYFATWAALAASAHLAGTVTPLVADANAKVKGLSVDGTPLVTLLLCALIVIFAALQNLATWEPMFMIACASIAILYSVLLLVGADKLAADQHKMLAIVMLLVWLCEAGIGTFRGPFIVTSNGFFASWIGLLAVLTSTRSYLPAQMRVVNARESVAHRNTMTSDPSWAVSPNNAA